MAGNKVQYTYLQGSFLTTPQEFGTFTLGNNEREGTAWKMIYGKLQGSFHAIMKNELIQRETEALIGQITALEEANNIKATDITQLLE